LFARNALREDKMKVYVAGKWEEKERVREVQDLLKRHGHTITHDWTREEEDLNHIEHFATFALQDKQGVMGADAYVGVFEKDLKYKGAFAEMGIAVALGIPIYILGQYADKCV
jgi:nucleoside 2-deoxyribosyltransferase